MIKISKDQMRYILYGTMYNMAAQVVQNLLIEKFNVAYSRRYIKRMCRLEHERILDK